MSPEPWGTTLMDPLSEQQLFRQTKQGGALLSYQAQQGLLL